MSCTRERCLLLAWLPHPPPAAGADASPLAALQYAVERGDLRAVGILIKAKVPIEGFVYNPPLDDVEFQLQHTNAMIVAQGGAN